MNMYTPAQLIETVNLDEPDIEELFLDIHASIESLSTGLVSALHLHRTYPQSGTRIPISEVLKMVDSAISEFFDAERKTYTPTVRKNTTEGHYDTWNSRLACVLTHMSHGASLWHIFGSRVGDLDKSFIEGADLLGRQLAKVTLTPGSIFIHRGSARFNLYSQEPDVDPTLHKVTRTGNKPSIQSTVSYMTAKKGNPGIIPSIRTRDFNS